MSVPNWKRNVNLLAVEIKAVELLEYTIRTATSEKNFPLRYKNELSLPIVELARKIMYFSVLGDRIPATDEKAIQEKRSYFIEALKIAELLKAEINMNMWTFRLKEQKAQYWDSLVDSWKKSCLDWLRSDYKKHGDKVCD